MRLVTVSYLSALNSIVQELNGAVVAVPAFHTAVTAQQIARRRENQLRRGSSIQGRE